MIMHKTIAILIAASALQTTVLHAQTNLFRVRFHAVCKPTDNQGGDNNNNNDNTMKNADLIRQCVGTGFTSKQLRRSFALVYNADADSIQVVSQTNGDFVCDVFQFQGGTVVTNGNRLERLTFVFAPGQTNAIGSAIIRERATTSGSNDVTRARINGKIQFTMPELLSIGNESTASTDNFGNDQFSIASADTNTSNGEISTNDVSNLDTNNVSGGDNNTTDNTGDNSSVEPPRFLAASADVAPTNSDVQICRGTFTVGKEFNPREVEDENATDNTGNIEQPVGPAAPAEIQPNSNLNTGEAGITNTGTINIGTTNSITTTNTTTTVVTTNSTTVSTNTTVPPIPSIMTGI